MLDGKTQQITHQTGTIVSHREYSHESNPHDVDSTLTMETPADRMLLFRVTVTNFELKSRSWSVSCSDYFEIMGRRYCGTDLASNRRITYVSATDALNLTLRTGGFSRDEGFLLEYHYYSKSSTTAC